MVLIPRCRTRSESIIYYHCHIPKRVTLTWLLWVAGTLRVVGGASNTISV